MDDNEEDRSQNGDSSSKDGVDEAIEQALRDPAKKARLLQRLGIGDSDENEENTGDNTKGTVGRSPALVLATPNCPALPLVGSL